MEKQFIIDELNSFLEVYNYRWYLAEMVGLDEILEGRLYKKIKPDDLVSPFTYEGRYYPSPNYPNGDRDWPEHDYVEELRVVDEYIENKYTREVSRIS